MILTLMRHPAVEIANGRCIGQTDIDLSVAGEASLESLAHEACSLLLDRIISSDLKRCRLLAYRIASRLHIAPVFDSIWREVNFGLWENRTWNDIRSEDSRAFADWNADFVTVAPPGGESFQQLQNRVMEAISNVCTVGTRFCASAVGMRFCASGDACPDTSIPIIPPDAQKRIPTVLVVTHAGVMRAAYAAFSKLPLSQAFDYHVPYGAMLHWTRPANACGNARASAVPQGWRV
jgi:broad specificity phosphatase PhoE